MIRIKNRTCISENGSTRATAYGMSNKIISHENRVFLAWLDHVADIQMRVYDRKTESWGDTILVGKGVDNHSGPAITMDSYGYIHTVFGPHHGPFEYLYPAHPYDIRLWNDPIQFGEMATYPSLICGPDDTLYAAYRSSSDIRNWRIHFHKKPLQRDWSVSKPILDIGVPDYGWLGNSLAIDADRRLHMAFCIYDQHPPGGKAYGYLWSDNDGVTWKNTAGEIMDLPVTPESDCFIMQDPGLDLRAKNTVIGPDGKPWFVVPRLNARTVELNHLTADGWEKIDLRPHLHQSFPNLEIVDGTLAFDREGTLYAAVTAGPPVESHWAQPEQEIYLLTSDDLGQSFHAQQVSETRPDHPSWLPSFERPYNHLPLTKPPCLLYTYGDKGTGCEGGEATRVFFVEFQKES